MRKFKAIYFIDILFATRKSEGFWRIFLIYIITVGVFIVKLYLVEMFSMALGTIASVLITTRQIAPVL